MPPKVSSAATKLAAVLAYIRNSGVAHNIKDLEKALPAAASVPAIQVKEFLQELADNDKIRVEKVGTGNWYWSFPPEEKDRKIALLTSVRAEHDTIEASVQKMREEIEKVEKEALEMEQREDEAGGNESREELQAQVSALTKELAQLKAELLANKNKNANFAGNSGGGNYNGKNNGSWPEQNGPAIPVRISQKREMIENLKDDCSRWTDQIQSMEGWMRDQISCDHQTFLEYKREWYGEEWDENEEGLKELF